MGITGKIRNCAGIFVLISAVFMSVSISADKADIYNIRSAIDLYERIDVLRDSLMAWKAMNAGVLFSDSLAGISDIDEIRGSYKTTFDDTSHDQIELTVYIPQQEYFEEYDLRIAFTRVPNKDLYTVRIYTDERTSGFRRKIAGLCDSLQPRVCSQLQSHIANRIEQYRLLPFPAAVWMSRASYEIPSRLILHGRDIDTIEYAGSAQLMYGLHRIFSGLCSYVDVLSIRSTTSGFYSRYLALVTVEGAKGYHLLEVTEKIEIEAETAKLSEGITVDLFPFIRSDNVSNLMKVMEYERHKPQIDVHRNSGEQ